MEPLDGESLDALGAKWGNRLPQRAAVAAAHRVLDVLFAAHTKDIVHRDIKPANVFATRDGQVRVLDVGIACVADAASSSAATRSGVMLGTLAFTASE